VYNKYIEQNREGTMLEYRFNVNVTEKDFYDNGSVKLSSLLFFFQEAATEHANEIGIGRDTLLEKNVVWILAKMKVRILKELEVGDGYYVMTYPRAVKSRFCPRDYYLYDRDDQMVAVGSAIWSLMDWTTRKVVRATELDFGGTFREDEAFPEGFEKIRVKEPVHVMDYVVGPEDIDENEHTNNCRYADMIAMASDISPIREFVLQFSKETREGETILLCTENAEDGQMVIGKLPDEQTVFQAKIII
jgi:acyl-ACP thioesterase